MLSKTAVAPISWQRGHGDRPLRWTNFIKAFSLFWLHYLEWSLSASSEPFEFRGARKNSPSATLGDGVEDDDNPLHQIIAEITASGKKSSQLQALVIGDNRSGKGPRDRRLGVGQILAPDCIAIQWEDHASPLSAATIRELCLRI